MDMLMIEQEVKTFVVLKPNLSSNEKAKRITKTLNLITEIYDKHQEELSVEEAYVILFGEDREDLGPHKIIPNKDFDRLAEELENE